MDKDNKKARLNALIAVRSMDRISKKVFYDRCEKMCEKADDEHMSKLLAETLDAQETRKQDRANCGDNHDKKRMKNKNKDSCATVNMKIADKGLGDFQVVPHGITYSVEEKKSTQVAENS